jgi:hypothetical protein
MFTVHFRSQITHGTLSHGTFSGKETKKRRKGEKEKRRKDEKENREAAMPNLSFPMKT